MDDALSCFTECWFNTTIKEFYYKDLIVKSVLCNPSNYRSFQYVFNSGKQEITENYEPDLMIIHHYVPETGFKVEVIPVSFLDENQMGFWVRPRFEELQKVKYIPKQ